MLRHWWTAARIVLAETFRPTPTREIGQDVETIMNFIRKFYPIPAIGFSGAVAYLVQGIIPRVNNLDWYVFPLIVANSTLTIMIFLAAVRLQIPKGQAVRELQRLVSRGIDERAAAAGVTDVKDVPKITSAFQKWEQDVLTELRKVDSEYAEEWSRIGNPSDYDNSTYFVVSAEQLKCIHEYTAQYKKLQIMINKIRGDIKRAP